MKLINVLNEISEDKEEKPVRIIEIRKHEQDTVKG